MHVHIYMVQMEWFAQCNRSEPLCVMRFAVLLRQDTCRVVSEPSITPSITVIKAVPKGH